jgi:type IV secretion system protein VirD4
MTRKNLVGILLALIAIWMVWYWWPWFTPFILQHHHFSVSALISEGQPPSRAINEPNGMPTPAAWLFLVLLGATLLVVRGLVFKPSKAHGSARNANRRDTRNYRARHNSPRAYRAPRGLAAILAPSAGALVSYRPGWLKPKGEQQPLLLGRYGFSTIALPQWLQQQNVLLTAMIGSGKTFGLIMRNLLRECGRRSLFISDVKAELVRKCAGYLSRFYEIWIFSPLDASQSDGYNPLMHIHSPQDALQFAQTWASNTGGAPGEIKGGDARFWMAMVIRAINMTVLHLRAAEPDAPFSRLADILSQHTYEELRAVFANTPSQIARREARQFFDGLDRNDKIVAGLLADLGTRFQLFLNDDVRQTTAHNTIDFVAMAERPVALFLAIPPRGAEMCAPLFAVFMSHMYNEWEMRAERAPGGVLPMKIQCYLDEFANLGRIYNFKEHLTTMRGMGIGLIIVLQSFSQLDELYGKPMRNILQTNCGTHLLLRGAGLEETRFYSERIGDTTVQTTSTTTRGSGLVAEHTFTTSETSRRLYKPEELRTMEQNKMLVLGSSAPPIMVSTKSYERDRAVRHLADLPFVHVVIRPQPYVPPTPRSSTAPRAAVGGPGGAGKASGKQKPKQPGPTIIVDADDHSGLAPE